MNITPHFTLEEFVASSVAAARGIDNTLPQELLPQARKTLEMMERIREELSRQAGHTIPISLSSGFRCLPLNRAVGSKDDSDHPKAAACDWTAPTFGTPLQIAQALAPYVSALGIGQLIYENPAPGRVWVHTGEPAQSRPANRIISILPSGTVVGIRGA